MSVINCWSDDIDCPENYPIYSGNSSNEIWTTKNGERIKIGDMSDDHVFNCYSIVMQTGSEYWQLVFKAELDKRNII